MFNIVVLIITICYASSHRAKPHAEKVQGQVALDWAAQLNTGQVVQANSSHIKPKLAKDLPVEETPIQSSDLMDEVEGDHGSSFATLDLGWLNFLLSEMWPEATKAINEIVETKLNPLLGEVLPGPISGLTLDTVSFPSDPVLSPLRVYKSKDSIKIKLGVSLETTTNIKMSGVSAGSGIISFSGELVLHLAPIIGTMPVIGGIRMYLVNPPQVIMDFTGLANIVDIPLLSDFVRAQINKVVSDLLVLPNVIGIPIGNREQGVDPSFLDQPEAIGIVRVTVMEAKNLPGVWMLPNLFVNPYVSVEMGSESWSSGTESGQNPRWKKDNWQDLVVYDREQTIGLSVYHRNVLPLIPIKDDFLGKAIPMRYGETVGQTWTLTLSSKDGKTEIGPANASASLTVMLEGLDVVACNPPMTGHVIFVQIDSISLPASVSSAVSAVVTVNGKSKATGVGRIPKTSSVLQDVVGRMHIRNVPANDIAVYTGLTESKVNDVIAKLSGGHEGINLHIGSRMYFPNKDMTYMDSKPMTIEVLDEKNNQLGVYEFDWDKTQFLQGVGKPAGCMKHIGISDVVQRLCERAKQEGCVEGEERLHIRGKVHLLSYRQYSMRPF